MPDSVDAVWILPLGGLLAAVIPPIAVEPAGVAECPSEDAVYAALARQGAKKGASSAWRLAVEREPSNTTGASLRLVLRDPGGAEALVRVLPSGGTACESLADAAALVVERYFRDISTADRSAPVLEATARPAAPAPADPRLVVLLGLAAWSRPSLPFAAAIELRMRIWGSLGAALGTLLPPFRTTEPVGPMPGSAAIEGWPIVFRAFAQKRHGRLLFAAGADGLLTFEQGRSADIPRPASASRVVLAAGPSLSLAFVISSRFRVLVDAGVARTLLGHSFVVGGHGSVLDPAAWQGLGGLRLGWAIP